MTYKPLKQYQLIAKALHKVKPEHPGPYLDNEAYERFEGRELQWNECVESIANELSDSAYSYEFTSIAERGVVDDDVVF